MIPQRTPDNEICGNGLKGRVAACRKRLRVNRVAKRSQVNNGGEESFAETTPSASRIRDYDSVNLPQRPNLPASVVLLNYRFGGAEAAEEETLQLIGEQEVGIP
jgi:hypothetical protein